MQIKEELKKSPFIVNLYEVIFGRLHSLRIIRVIQFRIKNKIHFSYGEQNKDKIFFVISSENIYAGIYSTILSILPAIEYAVKRKYIPVVDLENTYLPAWQDEDRAGMENPWEYYYDQPIKQYTLKEVYQSKHVIKMIGVAFTYKIKMPDWRKMFPINNKRELMRWNKIITSYIRPNEELQKKIMREQRRIFQSGYKVLGVGIRAELRAGAMRGTKLYDNHPQQPTCEELMNIVEDKMKVWGCDRILISCDDREYLSKFLKRFGERCYYIERIIRHFFENDIPIISLEEQLAEFAGIERPHLKMGQDYITEVYLLAQCHSLYSCRGGGYVFAHLLNGGQYEHIEVYDKGLYTIN